MHDIFSMIKSKIIFIYGLIGIHLKYLIEGFQPQTHYYKKDADFEIDCWKNPGEQFDGFFRTDGPRVDADKDWLKYRVDKVYGGYRLTIYDLQPKDAGEYYCDSDAQGRMKYTLLIDPCFPERKEPDKIIFHGLVQNITLEYYASVTPPIQWFLNYKRILYYNNEKKQVEYDNKDVDLYDFDVESGSLIIKNVSFEHAGKYSMTLEQQDTGLQIQDVNVIVKAKPLVLKDKSSVLEPIDHSAYKVRCVAFGLPIPSVSFYNSKDEFMQNYKFRTHEDTHERNAVVTSNEVNEYIHCSAKNEYGEDSHKIFIPPDVRFGESASVQRVVIGKKSVLVIEILGKRFPSIKWERFDPENSDFHPLLSYDADTKEVSFEDGKEKKFGFNKTKGYLIINEMSKEDVTLYRVSIKDWIQWQSQTIGVEVDVPAALLKDETNLILPVGHNSFRFKCTGVGNPPPHVFFEDDKGSRVFKEIEETLMDGKKVVILDAQIQTKTIKCIVKNNHSEDALEINIPPSVSFGKTLERQSLKIGLANEIKLQIKWSSKMPDIIWEKFDKKKHKFIKLLLYDHSLGKLLKNDSADFGYDFNKKNGHLSISKVQHKHSGMYKIKLNGNFGWISKTINVSVEDEKGKPPTDAGFSSPTQMSETVIGIICIIVVITLVLCCWCCKKKPDPGPLSKKKDKKANSRKKDASNDMQNASSSRKRKKEALKAKIFNKSSKKMKVSQEVSQHNGKIAKKKNLERVHGTKRKKVETGVTRRKF